MKKPLSKKIAKHGTGAPVNSLPNIGKDTAAKLEKIGITTAEEFLAREYEKRHPRHRWGPC